VGLLAGMADDSAEVSRHCVFDSMVDVLAALEAAAIEHLGVDDRRAIVIYQSAIFMLTATEGEISAVEAVEVEVWEPPANDIALDSTELLGVLVEEMLTMTDASRID